LYLKKMAMQYLIGTDEAGYGPNLGPLVISATVWQVPEGTGNEGLSELLTDVIVDTPGRAHLYVFATSRDLVGKPERLRFGGPTECQDRPLCLAGLEEVYGLRFQEFVPQQSLPARAEGLRRGEIDVALMLSTSSQLEGPDFVVLDDDLGLQPPENVIPLVRTDALSRWGPEFVVAVDLLSARLTTSDLRVLNLRVAAGDAVEDVARAWLEQNFLVEKN
jgi:glycine betaine/choline ABC-type transport system substrate-binding protein